MLDAFMRFMGPNSYFYGSHERKNWVYPVKYTLYPTDPMYKRHFYIYKCPKPQFLCAFMGFMGRKPYFLVFFSD